tara:strand:- start:1337 stop:1666 length:330 start_codon:yes stop_codon:yes gene_type:complete
MLNTIDVISKEWFDKVNGNSYFSGTVTLNYGTETEESFLMPFQYGYGNQHEQEAKCILTEFNKISSSWTQSLYSYCKENNIKFCSSIQKECKQKELKEIENQYNRNLNQ